MFRTNVNEMNVQPIDLGDELRQGVQFRLALAPIVICPPIARELLNRRELHALRCIRDRFPLRPLGCVDAPPQFGNFCFRKIHIKRTNCICLLAASLYSSAFGHGVLLLSSFGFFRLRTWRLLFLRPWKDKLCRCARKGYHKMDAGSIKSRVSRLVFTDGVRWRLRLPLQPELRRTQKLFRARSPLRGNRQSSPSSQAALRPPGPLRTGRESFPSPSSSPSNASVEETRFRNGKTLTMNPVMALGMKENAVRSACRTTHHT